jgi:hypothetical protein
MQAASASVEMDPPGRADIREVSQPYKDTAVAKSQIDHSVGAIPARRHHSADVSAMEMAMETVKIAVTTSRLPHWADVSAMAMAMVMTTRWAAVAAAVSAWRGK